MTITLKSLIGRNFKGGNFEINFSHTTEISGKNAAGKTRIHDAFTWLLFGKDSNDTKDFSIKDAVNLENNKLDHEVIGVLDVDGSEVTLKRVYKEKWTNKRGSPIAEFTGNETVYFYNDVPCSQSEYTAKINAIIPESIAKLITNPFAFNSLKWEQRREVLVKIAGNVSDSDISNGNSDFGALLAMLNGKSLSEFKKEISAKKKKIKETKDLIPARIDESSRSKPESADFEFIEKSLTNKRGLIEKIDTAINDKVKAHREASLSVIQKNNDLNRLKMQLQNLEAEVKRESQKEIREVETKIERFEFDIKKLNSDLQRNKTEVKILQSKIEKLSAENILLREDWTKINSDVMPPMDANATICPTCSQSLPIDKIESIKADYESRYNTNKAKKLAAINETGKRNKDTADNYQKDIAEYESSIAKINTAINDSVTETELLQSKKESLKLQPEVESAEITSLKEKIENFVTEQPPVIDDSELKQRKTELQNEVNELVRKFAAKEQIEKIDARVKELEKQEREMAQEIADLEKTEFTIDAFSKAKMDLVEQRVNSMFKNVSFRMFETQINGGITEACTCLVNSVPFSDANNAGKINAGLDIINTLSGFYNIYAPVFIDNCEAVNNPFPIASQLIKLIVTTEPLKIS